MTRDEAIALAEKRNKHMSRSLRMAGRAWTAVQDSDEWGVKLIVPALQPEQVDSEMELRRVYAIGAAVEAFGVMPVVKALKLMKGEKNG